MLPLLFAAAYMAQEGGSGERLRMLMRKIGGDSPSQMALTPLVRALFGK